MAGRLGGQLRLLTISERILPVRSLLLTSMAALLLTATSAWISPSTDERAMYGFEGPLEQNWLPREVAGWPAPFLADSPNTSVIHKVGLEDDFRPGPLLGTLSFWFVVVLAISRLFRSIKAPRKP